MTSGPRIRVALVAVGLVALATPAATAALTPGGTFVDDNGNIHEPNIEAIAAAGITAGCTTDRYCPSSSVTRGQMAVFIAKAVSLPPAATDHFTDDDGSAYEDAIDRMADADMTAGCGPGVFCPNDAVTRQEMAVFLVRAYGLSAGAGADTFSDDDASPFEDEIDRLAAAGVTSGCGAGIFCPFAPVRRDEMATFLTRAGGLTPIVPPPPAACRVFPADNIWNTRVDGLGLDPRSAEYVASIGAGRTLHPDFGSGVWPPGSSSPIGIPYVTVDGGQQPVPVVFTAYGDESDPGPYPIPAAAPIEGGPEGTGDRHVIAVDAAACRLYELFAAHPQPDGSWQAQSGAVYDLRSNALRPAGWTSADAAGLPIYPGLVRYEEVASGSIEHAIRFTAPVTQRAYVWPARHFASSQTDPALPPMGQRFRLRSDFDISGFDPHVQVILTAFKEYGIVLADNGAAWYISGAPDGRWDNDALRQLRSVPGSAFEAVDTSALMLDPDSGAALTP